MDNMNTWKIIRTCYVRCISHGSKSYNNSKRNKMNKMNKMNNMGSVVDVNVVC